MSNSEDTQCGLDWHNLELTKVIRTVSEYHPILNVVKAIAVNNKTISEKLEAGGMTTLGAKPLQTLAKRLDCNLVLAFLPKEETDESMQLLYDIENANNNFYDTLEQCLYKYCAELANAPKRKVQSSKIQHIQQLMERVNVVIDQLEGNQSEENDD